MKMRPIQSLLIGLVSHALLIGAAGAETVRLGILGDSNSDEYRADDDRGGRYASTTLNWVEILSRLRDVDVGDWGTRSEPRRSGYEYNWARSGARAADLPEQYAGLAEQVRQGRVEYVAIHVGINDFHPDGDYADIYNGRLSGMSLQRKITSVLSNIRTATRAMVDAGAKVVVTAVPDAGLHAPAHAVYPDPAKRQRVTEAIEWINSALRDDAQEEALLAFADYTGLLQDFSGRLGTGGVLFVGGEAIDMMTRGNDPRHYQLDDSVGHPGTVTSGFMANHLFVAALNREFGTQIPLLSDEEILCVAGIKPDASCANRPKPPKNLTATSP